MPNESLKILVVNILQLFPYLKLFFSICIGQFYIECNNDEEKYDAVKTIYSSITIGQAMIFCRYKRSAHALALRMINDKHCVELLSSELTIEQHAAVINRFRDGKFRVLVVTNVCTRGIDIDDISLVLNFEFPLIYDDVKRCFIDKPDCDRFVLFFLPCVM